jgi:hypothetical protein
MRKLTTLLFLLTVLCSCDPGYAVFVLNNSPQDKEIAVVEQEAPGVANIDSIPIADTLSTDFSTAKRHKRAVTNKDLSEGSYSFTLGLGETAIIKRGIGRPASDLSGLLKWIIVDDRDTIVLPADKRVQADRRFMRTKVVVRVE